MSEDDRVSPRTKIRKWLFKAVEKVNKTTAGEDGMRATHQATSKHRKRASIQPARPSKASQSTKALPAQANLDLTSAHLQSHGRSQTLRNQKDKSLCARHDADKTEEPAESSRPRECGITERLGLQGPFRSFGDEEGPNFSEKGKSAKRRRRALSSSSDLQPAMLDETGTDHQGNDHAFSTTRPNMNAPLLSRDSDHSTMLFSSPKQVERTYERRPRHKTREDCYEARPAKDRKKKTKQTTVRATKKVKPATDKRRNRMKSGGVLMHHFAAPNVANERLTVGKAFPPHKSRRIWADNKLQLRPGTGSGIFGHGRASSPVKRKALPDLAFPELDFLNKSRRDIRDHNYKMTREDEREKSQKVTKGVDSEANISHYFMSQKKQKTDDRNAILARERHGDKALELENQGSSSNIADPQDNLFLGFGTSGAISASPVKLVKELDARYVPTMSRRDTRSPTRGSSSFLDWSPSRAPLSTPIQERSVQHRPLASQSRSPSREDKEKSWRNERHRGFHSVETLAPYNIKTTTENDPRETYPTIHQAELLNDAGEVERMSEAKPPDSGKSSRSRIAKAEHATKLGTDMTANLTAEFVAKVQEMLLQDCSGNRGFISQKEYEPLEDTVKTFLHAYKTRLADKPEIEAHATSMATNEDLLSKGKIQPNQVQVDVGAIASNKTSPDHPEPTNLESFCGENKDEPPALSQPSQADDHPTYSFGCQRDYGHSKMLPPVPISKPNGEKDPVATPKDSETPHPNIHEVFEESSDPRACTSGVRIPFGSNPRALVHDAGRAANEKLALDTNLVQPCDSQRHPQSLSDLSRSSADGNDEGSTLEFLREQYHISERGNQHLVAEMSVDQPHIDLQDEFNAESRMHQLDIDNFNNAPVQDCGPFSSDSNGLGHLADFLQKDPSLHNALVQRGPVSISEAPEYEYERDFGRPSSRKSYPRLVRSHLSYPHTDLLSLSFAHRDASSRGGTEVSGSLEGFWKPHKLY